MAVPIRMPDLGTTVEEFRIMAWLVREGDTIGLGDALAEIETDKAVTQLESPAQGVLLRQCVNSGDMAYTGDILAYVGEAGEELPEDAGPDVQAAAVPQTDTVVVNGSSAAERVAFFARNLARELEVDLSAVQGTGAGGVITREDVLRAQAGAPMPTLTTLSRGQMAVARAVSKSWTEIPHLFISATIDMTTAQRLRAQRAAAGRKISVDAIFLYALAHACQTYPICAAHLEGDEIVSPSGLHLAVAVGVDNDLFLPVIRDVDRRSLEDIHEEIVAAAAQAKAGVLPAERLSGACMAMSNLGMFPVETFDPIIFPGHSVMLAVGTIQPAPVVIDGGIHVRPLCRIRLAADHRLINGRLAAAFATKVKEIIEGVA
jgi:pyruvate dehydrogenase E2 component (dihydrolipoamide acetyltransferase)